MEQSTLDIIPITEQISALAEAWPNWAALTHRAQSLTYGELNERSGSFASYLAACGATPESTVAICLERSIEGVVAALGAMRAGAAYVPLDPSWPDARLRYAVRDSGAAVLVARAPLLERLGIDVPGVDPQRDAAGIALLREPVRHNVHPDSLAYVIYTSGSTGVPKGVEITHRNLAHLAQWHREAFAVARHDRASHLAGLGFDAAVWEIWPNLCAGATIVLADEDVRFSPSLLQEWIVRERLTVAFIPTAHAGAMMRMAWPAETALRCLLTGGDTLQQSPPADLPFSVINNYGPTECTVVSTTTTVRPGTTEPPSIGRAVHGASIYLLDDAGSPVSNGSAGEIYIGGEGVGRGYRNMQDATRAAFPRDSFSAVAGARMFRTGDRARRTPDGDLHFLGRVDRQIKIRGQRVELDEIGTNLMQHPQVEFAVVVAQEGQLVAYIFPGKAEGPAAQDLQAFLLQRLPDYMLPATMVRLERLPLSGNGKLDLRELPQPSPANRLGGTPMRAAVSPTAEKVLAMVRQLLENDSIGADENFFLAGGHSLLGMQLVMSLQRQFDLKIALQQLFEAPTATELSYLIERLHHEARIATIWKDVLGRESLGVEEDFFSVGGTPKLAAAVRHRINGESGEPMTEAEFNSNPTIRRQAELAVGQRRIEYKPPAGVLPLRPLGSRPRIFWVHYLNANLARAMGDDQPFFSVSLTAEDVQLLGGAPTLEKIGACMADKIRKAQPNGPYILGGLCLGGVLAYEIASQLRAAGEEISLLVVIDPPSPSNVRDYGSLARRWAYLRYLMKRAEWLGPRTTLLYFMERLIKTLPRHWWKHFRVDQIHVAQELVETAVYFYRPQPCKGPVLLLLASEQLPHSNSLARWKNLVPQNLHTEFVDAYHRELMEPENAAMIARAIASRLTVLGTDDPSTLRAICGSASPDPCASSELALGLALQE